MLLYTDKVDEALLLLLLFLLMNLLSEYSKCLWVCLDVVFCRFLYAGLLCKDRRIWVLVILGGFVLCFYGAWYGVSVVECLATIISIQIARCCLKNLQLVVLNRNSILLLWYSMHCWNAACNALCWAM